jgi:hypothetical protein
MTGFDKKVLHLSSDKPVSIHIEIDFLGDGSWETYERLTVSRYAYHVFPSGFAAHWVRLTPSAGCTASAEFFYS